jgi:hypothetical protein
VGSVKWLEDAVFDHHDYVELVAQAARLPGAGAGLPLIAVSRAGCAIDGVTYIGPDDLVAAYAATTGTD